MTFYISIMNKKEGTIGNRIFMYMYISRLIKEYIPDSEIINFCIKELNIDFKEHELTGRILNINGGHKHSMNELAYFAKKKIYDALYFHGFAQRMEYYPSVDFCSSLFQEPEPNLGISNHEILLNVRGSEILKAIHPDYVPVPVDFMEQIIKETGLSPVIMGQVGNDFYSESIKTRFPNARILKHISPLKDFDTIRNSKNIILSVSTFSWSAAWLSKQNHNIYMPALGIFNPSQRKDVDLLPLGDQRYHFYEFPVLKWDGKDKMISYICGSGKQYKKLSHAEIAHKINY